MGGHRSCAPSPALHTTTISSVSGNTAVASDEKASCISTKTSLPVIRLAVDGGSEMSHTTCGRSGLVGFGASHGARCSGRVRTAGGHESTEVQNGIAPERPPDIPSVWPGVSGVDMTAGVTGAAAAGDGTDQNAPAGIPGNDCCWGSHAIIPGAEAAGWRLNKDVAGVEM